MMSELEKTSMTDAARETSEQDECQLWSFFRRILSQGGAIHTDYRAGKYQSYEAYSARLDAAAHERVEEWLRQRAAQEGK